MSASHGLVREVRGSYSKEEPVPTYEYACTACEERLEVVQSFTDDALTVCPVCGGRLRKVFSPAGIIFKGAGFYRTDSRSGAKGSSNGAGKTGDSDGSESKTKSSDTKTSDSKSSDGKGTESKSSDSSSGSSSGGSGGNGSGSGKGGGGKGGSAASSSSEKVA
jgi:putative FmdB family regulatory protein